MPVAPFPQRIVPMQPELASEPFHREGWVYEEKLDGWRMIAYKDGLSRSGVDHTARFPGIAAAVAGLLAHQLILEGEVCVFDDQLVSQFHLLGWGGADESSSPAVQLLLVDPARPVEGLRHQLGLHGNDALREGCGRHDPLSRYRQG